VERRFEMVSAYHAYFEEAPGRETRMTCFNKKRLESGYHLDYVCVPRRWANRIRSVEVGAHGQWLALSDHMPLVVDLDV
jgi:exonuclease III